MTNSPKMFVVTAAFSVSLIASGCASFSTAKFDLEENRSQDSKNFHCEVDWESYQKTFSYPGLAVPKSAGLNVKPRAQWLKIDSMYVVGQLDKWHDVYVIKQEYNHWIEGDSAIKDFLLRNIDRAVGNPAIPLGGDAEYSVKLRFVAYENTVNSGWTALSIVTLLSVNLLGVPISSQTAIVDLRLDVSETPQDATVSYESRGKGTAYSAMYWGYQWGGLMSATYLRQPYWMARTKAIAAALKDLRHQLEFRQSHD